MWFLFNVINNIWSKSPVYTDFLVQLKDGSGINAVHQSEIQTDIRLCDGKDRAVAFLYVAGWRVL